jgi:hypothetical protein
MAEHTNDRQMWRDFDHTVRVVTARALAEIDVNHGAPVTRFAVTLLAAAGSTGINLPTGEVLAEGRQLGIRIVTHTGELAVTLQLKGFAALTAHKRQPGRLTTLSGTFDVLFQFSERGTAICLLPDTPEVRLGLQTCMIEVLPIGP